MTLHVFNPSHDEALAAGSPYYYPSTVARRLADEWAGLPALWAEPGDVVWLPEGVDAPPGVERWAPGVEFTNRRLLPAKEWARFARIAPWGWDMLVRHRLRRAGAPESLLPTDEALAQTARLSSRETTACVLPALVGRLRAEGLAVTGESVVARTEAAVRAQAERWGGAMVKSLWSCSGRGVFRIGTSPNASCAGRIARLIREHGGVEMEPVYEGLADFALEFEAEDGGVRFVGLSFFATGQAGAYAGNVVAPQAALAARIAAFAPGRDVLSVLPQVCVGVLTETLGNGYRGPLGVDMMWVRGAQGIALHPCIEVNLRRTMGHAALSLARRGADLSLLPAAWHGLFLPF